MISYFVYDSAVAAVAIFLVIILFGLIWLTSLIPFVGAYIQQNLMDRVLSWTFAQAGIGATWLTDIIWGFYAVTGALVTIVTSLIAAAIIALLIWGLIEWRRL